MTENNSQSTVDRRTVLKSASAATGLALTGNVRATSRPGSVSFAEIRLEHDVTGQSSPEANYPFYHVDEFSTARSVDQHQSKLYINTRYEQEALDLAKKNETLVAGDEYSSLPTRLGSRTTHSPLTKLGMNYRAVEGLTVEDGYRIPRISVKEKAGELSVEAEGKEIAVSRGKEDELALSNREVTVEVFDTVETDPDEITIGGGEDWDKPWRKPERKHYWTETVTLTPKVRVQNYGNVEVIGVDSVAPQKRG